MKTLKLEKNQKFEIHLNEIKDTKFLDTFGNILLKCVKAEPGKQIDVSKIWCNQYTYDLFSDKLLKMLSKKMGKNQAKKSLSWGLLQYGPAFDRDNAFSIPDNFFWIEDDCLRDPRD